MADAEARKILAQAWALDGDRQDPEDVGLTRNIGWPVSYEQPGAGVEPERTVFNQLLAELDESLGDKLRFGVLPWDARIDYVADAEQGYSFVTGSDGRLYVARVASGPGGGNATDPVADGQSVWDVY